MPEAITIETSDGLRLEGQLASPDRDRPRRAGMVLCHPHPQFGGSMRSLVISALFEALPGAGVGCLRFNFRGVEGSAGAYGHGDSERLDAQAALDLLSERLREGMPLILTGWSFGADVAVSCADSAIAGWLLIAVPLRYCREPETVAGDPRPKYVVLAQHDEFRAADEVAREIESWRNASVHVVGGASHFFVGRTDNVVAHALAFVDSLTGEPTDRTAS